MMAMNGKAWSLASAAALLPCLLGSAAIHAAEAWPSKPIRFVVPFAAGGGADFTGRLYGRYLADAWGGSVLVENRPGAGSNIGTQFVAQAPADGYTVLVTSTAFAINPALYANAGYDPIKGFEAVVNAGYSPTILFVHPSMPAKTVKELLALGRSRPLSYASAGVGTVPFLTVEYLFNLVSKADITHVPYGGAGPALQAVLGGHVPVGVATYATPGLNDRFEAGKLRPLAVMAAKRTKERPEVPTASEAGFPGYVDSTWQGVFVPAGTPPAIVERLNAGFNEAMKSSVVSEALNRIGFEREPNGARQFADYVRGEVGRWAKVVKETGVKAN